MIHFVEIGTALVIYVIVLLVPGPNMLVILNLALGNAKKEAVVSGVGFGVAATCLALISYLGISSFRNYIPGFDNIMYMFSGTILVSLGWLTKIKNNLEVNNVSRGDIKSYNSLWTAFLSSYLLNISNPKALALLTGIYGGILLEIAWIEAVFFMIFCLLLEIIWYYFLVRIFTNKMFYNLLGRHIKYILLTTKGLFFSMGAYLIFISLFGLLG